MSLIYAIATAIVAQVFVYSGLIFMAGKLFPTFLNPIYHLFPAASYRLLFATMTTMLAGNYFFQRLYYLQPVLIAGIISTVCGILIMNIYGLIIEQKAPSILMATGVVVLIAGAVICVYARSQI
jgi:hypothetical protein